MIYPAQKAPIALLLAQKITFIANHADFADVFSKKSAELLPKRIGIKKDAIKLE